MRTISWCLAIPSEIFTSNVNYNGNTRICIFFKHLFKFYLFFSSSLMTIDCIVFFRKVLVLITDGELTSGKYDELNQVLGDLASLNVEIFVVAEGDDLVEDGIKKMASQPLNDHRFSLTPNSLNVPYATQSLATSICNGKFPIPRDNL